MRTTSRWMTVMAMAACLGCDGGPGAPEVPANAEPYGLQGDLLAAATWKFNRNDSVLYESGRRTIRTAEEWTAFWNAAARQHEGPPPAMDFTQEMIVVATMGGQGSSGYHVRFDGAFIDGARLLVVVHETSPGPRCGTLTVITWPAAALALPRTDLPVTFIERRTIHRC